MKTAHILLGCTNGCQNDCKGGKSGRQQGTNHPVFEHYMAPHSLAYIRVRDFVVVDVVVLKECFLDCTMKRVLFQLASGLTFSVKLADFAEGQLLGRGKDACIKGYMNVLYFIPRT